MSETVKSFIGRVAVVEQEGSAVRVLLNEGETMYAARDLLAACGCAYPTKWCQREAKSESDVKLVKLPFPVNGKTGGASRRSVPMYFVTERCGRMILDIFGCSKETRAWIEGKVFACTGVFVGVTWLCTELFCEWNDPPYGRSGFQCSSINPKPFAIVYYAENKKRLVPMDSIEKVER